MALDVSYSGRNVGDIFYTLRKETTLNGAVACDGGTYLASDFEASGENSPYVLCVNGKLPSISFANYDLEVKNNGCCASFGLDQTSGKFRVPTINDVFIEAGDGTTLAKYIKPGLPNITGGNLYISYNEDYNFTKKNNAYPEYGAMSSTRIHGSSYVYGAGFEGDSHSCGYVANFDASRSNSIYGASNTVQPKAIKLRPMVQLIALGSAYVDDDDDGGDVQYQVPYIFVPGTEAKALEVNANFDYVMKVLSDNLKAKDVVHIEGKETITGQKTFAEPVNMPSIELVPSTTAKHGGFIDFHWGGSATDFTARIIESVRGYLELNQSPLSSDSSNKIATTKWVRSLFGSQMSLYNTIYFGTNQGYLAFYSDAAKTKRTFLLQWGYVGGSSTVTFPIAFVQVGSVNCTTNRTAAGKYGFNHCGNVSTTSMYVRLDGAGWWLALGK